MSSEGFFWPPKTMLYLLQKNVETFIINTAKNPEKNTLRLFLFESEAI